MRIQLNRFSKYKELMYIPDQFTEPRLTWRFFKLFIAAICNFIALSYTIAKIINFFLGLIDDAVSTVRLDSNGSGQDPVAGSCEHGSEPSSSIKSRNFLTNLSDYQLLKEDSAPWSSQCDVNTWGLCNLEWCKKWSWMVNGCGFERGRL
jgi:hypothetical protein